MTWNAINLATPVADASTQLHKLTLIELTPWTHGVREGETPHTWLAFPNAVAALVDRLPESVPGLFVIAVAASNAQGLAQICANLHTVFPVRQVDQWRRHAESLASLELDKFDLVEPVPVYSDADIRFLPVVADRHRKQRAVDAKTAAASVAAADPLSSLNTFQSAKNAHDSSVDAPLPALAGGDGWRFYADADIETALQTGHPDAAYTLTAMLALVGSPADLAYLVEVMP